MITAHYDHVGIIDGEIHNGADDDGSGTVTVLELAQAYMDAVNDGNGPRRSVLLMTVVGEEKGLLGSSYYVENPVLPLNQMVYCFNSDNAGYNDTSLISVIGLTRTTAEKNIFSANSYSKCPN